MSIIPNKAARCKQKLKKTANECDDLIVAIITQAANDYRLALRGLIDQKYKPRKDELEEFFLSSWFEMLTDISGQSIIDRLKQEWMEECKYAEKEVDPESSGIQKGTTTD